MSRAEPIPKGPYREALAVAITQLAQAGINDPQIGHRLGLTLHQVRRIRREDGVEPGHHRTITADSRST